MPPDSSNSAPSTAPTSKSAPKTPASESEFLTKQAADAKAAIARVSDDIKHDLAQGIDPRAWMQVAPWTTLAAGAVAGFIAAAAIVPSKEQQALRRLRRMEKVLHLDEDPPRNGHKPDEKAQAEAGKPSLLGAMMGSILAAVQPLLMSALTSAMSGKTAPPPATGNGAAPAGNPPPSPDAAGADASDI
jgi:hypothetical protein